MEICFVLFLWSNRVIPTFICRLTRLYAANVLQPETITSVGSNLYQLSFEHEGQLDEPGYGCDTQRILAKLEANDIKTIFDAVRKFYVALIGVLQSERTASYL